jgi:hypothetical protein
MASTSDESSGQNKGVKKTSVNSASRISKKTHKHVLSLLTEQPFSLSALLISMERDPNIFKKALMGLKERDIDDMIQHLPIKAYKIYSVSKQLSKPTFI